MGERVLKPLIQLRRDKEINYSSSYVPRKGEVLFVDTSDKRLRLKVGTGDTKFSELPYQDNWIDDSFEQVILRGYYLNGKFYRNSTYTEELPKYKTSFYIDNNTKIIYQYDGSAFFSVNDALPNATETTAGIMKLYNSLGLNVDGAMTQRATTTEIQKKVEVSVDGETVIFSNNLLFLQ